MEGLTMKRLGKTQTERIITLAVLTFTIAGAVGLWGPLAYLAYVMWLFGV
jgi:hypothetical protein